MTLDTNITYQNKLVHPSSLALFGSGFTHSIMGHSLVQKSLHVEPPL